jgi:hypothetical protein
MATGRNPTPLSGEVPRGPRLWSDGQEIPQIPPLACGE